MKKITFLLLVFVGLLFSSCQQEMMSDANSENDLFKPDKNQQKVESDIVFEVLYDLTDDPGCTETVIMPLTAGQHIDVGTLELSNDEDYIYVTYNVENTFAGGPSDWFLDETHLFVGCDASEIPINGGGNPVIGHFPYSKDHDPVKSITYKISLTDFDCDSECLVIAAHASVITLDSNNEEMDQETAFGGCDNDSSEFPGRRWGCYFEYCVESCFISSFARKEHEEFRNCINLNIDGNSIAGWSNWFRYKSLGFSFPLYANVAEECNLTNPEPIGVVKVLKAENGVDFKVKYILFEDNDYTIYEINLFLGMNEIKSSSEFFNMKYDAAMKSTEWIYWPQISTQDIDIFVTAQALILKN